MNQENQNLLDFNNPLLLKTLEFSVESRIRDDEQVTLITHPDTILAIKRAIAEGKIFTQIYSQLIFKPDSTMTLSDITIVPDHIIEEVIQEDLKAFLNDSEEIKKKMSILNEKMNISEETLNRISQLSDEELTKEELQLKCEIQDLMLQVGMNLDLQFSNSINEDKINNTLNKVLEKSQIQTIDLGGVNG